MRHAPWLLAIIAAALLVAGVVLGIHEYQASTYHPSLQLTPASYLLPSATFGDRCEATVAITNRSSTARRIVGATLG
jgi:hypothetical protein